MGRLVGVLVLILVLYAILSQPLTSAAMTRSLGATLADAGTSAIQFFTAVTTGSTTSRSRTASTATSTASSYTVRRGDTLSTIAQAHGTTAGALAARNGLANPNVITPGQRLAMR
ncbi:MAG: LysM domain [Actinomycetota bacterium]|jgi:LysM repeat protein|nr:LysM domain [Actinomycetota bacterium]